MPDRYIAAGGELQITVNDNLQYVREYTITDNNGNIRLVLAWDGSNVTEKHFDYDPFGNRIGSTASEEGKFAFNFAENTNEHGYAVMGARLYDSQTGRFLANDPLKDFFTELTPYHYAFNSPLTWRDPSGLAPEKGPKEGELLGNQPDPDAFGAGELFGANSQVDGYWDLVFVSKIVNVNAKYGWNSNSPLGPICLEISWSPTYEYRTIPGGGGGGGSNGGPGIGGARTGSSGGGQVNGQPLRNNEPTLSPITIDNIQESSNQEKNSSDENDSGVDQRFSYNSFDNLNGVELYLVILLDKTGEQFGIKDILAIFGIGLGQPTIKYPRKGIDAKNSTGKSSPLSKGLTKIMEYFDIPNNVKGKGVKTLVGIPKMFGGKGVRVALTKSISKIIGRWIPILGWGVLAYDVINVFYNTTKEFLRIINGESDD